jgi:chromosome segregation ATPase
MSENTEDTKPRRALNDVQFAAAIDSLAKCKFEVRDPYNSLNGCRFSTPGRNIVVDGYAIDFFLRDVQAIVSENAQYQREHTALRHSNKQFCDENARLNVRIEELTGELVQRTSQRDALIGQCTDLRAANKQFADEHVRLDARIGEQAGVLEDNERHLKNQAITIGNFQAERGAYLQKAASDAEAMKILARRKGDVEELVDDLRVERENLLKRIDCQRNTIIGFQQRAGSFDAEAARLREELAAERAARRTEAANAASEISVAHQAMNDIREALSDANGKLASFRRELNEIITERETAKASFRLADRALSARNETLASLEKLLAAKEEERQLDVKTLKGVIAEKNEALESLRRNVTHYALEALKTRSARVYPVKLAVLVHADGSVNVETEAPVVFTGNVKLTGEVSA